MLGDDVEGELNHVRLCNVLLQLLLILYHLILSIKTAAFEVSEVDKRTPELQS